MALHNRIRLIEVLDKVGLGLTGSETLEQSDTYVFQDGEVITFSGEVLSKTMYDVGFTAAVPGADLKKVLAKFPDVDIELELHAESELVIKGKRKRAGLAVFEQILLPINEVPQGGKLRPVPEDLPLLMVQAARICGKDHMRPRTTHIHITPDRVEATDGDRFFRSSCKTGLRSSTLLPASAVLALGTASVQRAGICNGWLFLERDHVFIAMRCADTEYFSEEELDSVIRIEDAHKVRLPTNLPDVLERASVMADKGAGFGEGDIHVSLTPGKIKIRTEKNGGWYEEIAPAKYKGDAMKFTINPSFLKEILARAAVVHVSAKKLKIEEGSIQFVVGIEEL